MDEYKVGCRAHWAGIACVKVPRATDVWCLAELPCGWSIVREMHKLRLERGMGRTQMKKDTVGSFCSKCGGNRLEAQAGVGAGEIYMQ